MTCIFETPPASVTLDGKNMLCDLSIPVKSRLKFEVVYFKPTLKDCGLFIVKD